MPSLKDIRKRIKSVKSTQKITSAMKLVAAAKLRRAQENIQAARPYALELGAMLRRVATRASDAGSDAAHPLLDVHDENKHALLMVLTSDRGLCGAFNTNIIRAAEGFISEYQQKYEKVSIGTIGRRGRDYFQKRYGSTMRDFPGVFDNLEFRRATEIAEELSEQYVDHDLNAVYLIYNEFKSALSQRVVVEPLLPIVKEELPVGEDADYLYEPSRQEVLEKLVPRYLATGVWRAMLESSASEHGARMTSMDSATKNAKDLSESLTLQYNRARQAAITGELMDIVGGVEALKG